MAVFNKVKCTNPKCSNWRMRLLIEKKDADGIILRDERGKPIIDDKPATCTACGSKVKPAKVYSIQYYINVDGKRTKKTVDTPHTKKKEAQATLAAIKATVSPTAGATLPSGDIPFNAYALKFKLLHAGQIQDTKREAVIIQHLIRYFSDKPLNSFLKSDLEAYMNHRRKQDVFEGTVRLKKDGTPYQRKKPPRKVRASTVGRELCVLRMILNHAVDDKKLHYPHVVDNPFHKFKIPKSREVTPLWTLSDLDRIFSYMAPGLRPLMLFIAETGCRIEEAMSLKRCQVIDKRNVAILVRTKTDDAEDTSTDLHLSVEAMAIINEQPGDNEYVFTNPMSGTRYLNPRTSFRRAAKKAGFVYTDGAYVRPHDLRHIFLTALAEGGANDDALMHISRHRDRRSLKRYLHARNKMVHDAFKKINRS